MSTVAPERGSTRMDGMRLVIAMAGLLWVAEIVDLFTGHRLDRYGIQPRETDGLIGILAAPLLHGGFGHLISNTVPFVVLGVAIALRGAARVIAVTAIVVLAGGLGTWLFGGAGTVHIGASGVVFGYATYLLTHGFFERNVVGIVIGLVVGAIWGTSLLVGLLPQPGISWQGHLFGAIGGIVAARALAESRRGAA